MDKLNNEKLPIYMQIVEKFKHDILTGRLKSDEPLPSMRSLSKTMNVSLVTAKKAYDTMEELGLSYTIPGKGTFVNYQNLETIKEYKMMELEEKLSEMLIDAKNHGISKNQIIELLNLL
ncbi:GntR family transcriptional regulator [Peptoniphilus indolicus]|uniref:GntR family transcriptional regulator n=2 Tax=Peptoniphilus indolicus TaxID=33030 RepID=G4D549_9FIRM|nr:GntR family transcriptional regulator [Peptoniphilus indolicus]EGY79350.1 GntR family transcriptional regulator [Peptoniphilus indolicus ATCC 29427]SUB76323.1 HTH-type transcriptional repressor yvoA [Peptoniphilus indolicus]